MAKDGKFQLLTQYETGLSKLKQGKEKSAQALIAAQNIIKGLENGDWQGEAKDAYLALFMLTKQYHEALQEMLERNCTELEQLKTELAGWESSSNSVRRIKEA